MMNNKTVAEFMVSEIHAVSGSFGVDSNGIAHPHITSKGNVGSDIDNAIAMIEMANNPEEFFK